MAKVIPIYHKMPGDQRPSDELFYWLTRDGLFKCRNDRWFTSDIGCWAKWTEAKYWKDAYHKPARPTFPRHLAEHEEVCKARFPTVPAGIMATIVSFFREVYEAYHSEAVVQLCWNDRAQQYLIQIVEQRVEKGHGTSDVKYDPTAAPPDCVVVGDVHSHGQMAAYSSYTDKSDEKCADGLHVILGYIMDKQVDVCVNIAVDGRHFELSKEELAAAIEPFNHLEGYHDPTWFSYVKQVEPTYTWTYPSSSSTSASGASAYPSQIHQPPVHQPVQTQWDDYEYSKSDKLLDRDPYDFYRLKGKDTAQDDKTQDDLPPKGGKKNKGKKKRGLVDTVKGIFHTSEPDEDAYGDQADQEQEKGEKGSVEEGGSSSEASTGNDGSGRRDVSREGREDTEGEKGSSPLPSA